ncbi:MAG: hypothetical protein JXB43_10315 [Dehalococcoidia bacterium]|nr:hypothetical protein [Dehalococcoidia bacterium]
MAMWQINFCPRCGARADCNGRFCGACGLDLSCVVEPVPSPWYDYQCTYQQWVPQSPTYNQAAAHVDSDQYQQRYVYANGGTVTPLSAEVSRLLVDFFSKSPKHNRA